MACSICSGATSSRLACCTSRTLAPARNRNLTGKPGRFLHANPVITSGYNALTFGDVDGDGNVDLVIGVIGGAFSPYKTAIEYLYHVQQAPKGTWTVKSKQVISMIDVGSDAAPALADVTGDGLLDLIVGSKFATNDQNTGTITWFENVGSAKEPAFRERGLLPMRGQYNYAPAVADLDGDGLQDLLTGAWSNQVRWWKNTGTRAAPAWTLADTALVTITRGSEHDADSRRSRWRWPARPGGGRGVGVPECVPERWFCFPASLRIGE